MHHSAADTILAAWWWWGMESLLQYLAWHESHRSRERKRGRRNMGMESAGAKNGLSPKTYSVLCKHRNNSLKVSCCIIFLWQIQKQKAIVGPSQRKHITYCKRFTGWYWTTCCFFVKHGGSLFCMKMFTGTTCWHTFALLFIHFTLGVNLPDLRSFDVYCHSNVFKLARCSIIVIC